jgi:hypothetical protein
LNKLGLEFPTPEPAADLQPMSNTGVMTIKFNVDMFVPEDPKSVNYSGIFDFSVVSALDGSEAGSADSSRRLLAE